MLLPRARTLLWSLVLCLPLAVFGWLAATLCLISQEDYTPEPGSFTYYIGISSLVRHAPLVGALGKAEYFGTVGDGNKPPHDLMSYDVEFASIGPATHAFDAYLLGKGYSRTADDETPGPSYGMGRRVRHARYTASSGQVVYVEVVQASSAEQGPVRYRATMAHYD